MNPRAFIAVTSLVLLAGCVALFPAPSGDATSSATAPSLALSSTTTTSPATTLSTTSSTAAPSTSEATTTTTTAVPLPSAPVAASNVAYGFHPRQVLDIYPATTAQVGTIVWVHGGGWVEGAKTDVERDSYANVMALRDRGYSIVSVEYRLSTDAPYPASKNDVADALGYVLNAGPLFGLNTSNVTLAGHSAGATMALMIGNDPAGPRPSQIVAVAPITSFDWTIPLGLVSGVPTDFWAPPAHRSTDQPIATVTSSSVRALLVHGDSDVIVPVDHSTRYASIAAGRGADVSLKVIDSGPAACRNHDSVCGVSPDELAAFIGGV